MSNTSMPTAALIQIRSTSRNPYLAGSNAKSSGNADSKRYIPQQGTNERYLADSLDKNRQQALQSGKKKMLPLPKNVTIIELDDFSRLTISAFRVSGTTAVFRLAGASSDCELPLECIVSARFGVAGVNEILHPHADWSRLIEQGKDVSAQNGDRMIIGAPGAFDVYHGILKDITAETVSFETEGETLPIPLKKVFGILLYRTGSGQQDLQKRQNSQNGDTSAELFFWNGTHIAVRQFAVKPFEGGDGKIHWTANAGFSGITPLDEIEAVKFKQANVFSLLELQPAVIQSPNVFSVFDEVRRKQITQPGPVVIDGVFYPQGFLIPAPAELEYKLPPNVTVFRSVFGVEDRYRPFAAAELQITADSQILGTWTLRGDKKSVRVKLHLPKEAKVLRMRVSGLKDFDVPAIIVVTETDVR